LLPQIAPSESLHQIAPPNSSPKKSPLDLRAIWKSDLEELSGRAIWKSVLEE